MYNLILQVGNIQAFMQNKKTATVYESCWDDATDNYWCHTRLMSSVLEVLTDLKDFRCLTSGDGAGMDAWCLIQAEFSKTVASDLSDAALEETDKRFYINEFRAINEKQMNLPNESFHLILCKETLHNISNPHRTIYECLKMAKLEVHMIEPQDPMSNNPIDPNKEMPGHEKAIYYVHIFSKHGIQKIFHGLNLLRVAINGKNYAHIPVGGFLHYTNDNQILNQKLKSLKCIHTKFHKACQRQFMCNPLFLKTHRARNF